MVRAKNTHMQIALKLAKKAGEKGEVPVGAVVVYQGTIIAKARNKMRQLNDASAHAEMLVIKKALKKLKTSRLIDCDIYVTLEPCTMCAGAISHLRFRRVYYGAEDIKGGAIENGVQFFSANTCHHRPEVISGLEEEKSEKLLKNFFALRR
ncbi:MAG: nucleoside deaminase [Devosiaceae bacterium]|nr:nucleoside deaminase [Devosiaceae bacterium]